MVMADAEPYRTLPEDKRAAALSLDLAKILTDYGSRPVYQRLSGKPVVFFFPKPETGDQQTIPPETWSTVRQGLAKPFLLAHEHPNPKYKDVVDLPYGWIDGLSEDGKGYGATYLEWLYPALKGLAPPVGIGIAYPGFDDSGVYSWTDDPARKRRIDRLQGGVEVMDLTWDAADRGDVAWVQIATFNDWNEGTEIEPSVEFGSAPLALAAARSAAFKKAAAPKSAAWEFAAKFHKRRAAGVAEAAFGKALEAFVVGDHEKALATPP